MIIAVGYLLLGGETKMDDSTVASTQALTVVPADSADTMLSVRGSQEWIATLQFAVHQLVNFERQKNSLSVLDQDPELAEIARAHSDDMAVNDFFEHENLQGLTAADRGNAVGYTCLKKFGDFYTEGISKNLFQGYLYASFNS